MEPTAETGGDREPKRTFEEALARLEVIVAEMESGKQSLERSLELFEEGMALSKQCAEMLAATEKKIEVLVKRADQSLEWAPVDPEQLDPGHNPESG